MKIYAPEIDYEKDSDNIISEYQKLYRPDLTRREGKLLGDFLFFLSHDLEEQKEEMESQII